MCKMVDLTGERFGRLTVISKGNKRLYGKPTWLCRCDCGRLKYAITQSLKNGDVKSCGCLQRETRRKNAINLNEVRIHHGMSDSRIYRIYNNMISRCYRKSSNGYENYGDRGIRVCDEWLGKDGFKNFMEWSFANGYSDKLTIDRIDNNGNYEPKNCKWSTRKEQANNTRATIFLEYNGKSHSLTEWSEITGLSKATIYTRLRKGFSNEKALGYK
ncbi:hypothetical protein [Eubacterium ramulus]